MNLYVQIKKIHYHLINNNFLLLRLSGKKKLKIQKINHIIRIGINLCLIDNKIMLIFKENDKIRQKH